MKVILTQVMSRVMRRYCRSCQNSSTVNCFNTGSVTANGDYVATAGGIVGNCDPATKVETSYNTGQIKSTIVNTSHPKKINAAGGIIGGLTAASANIKNCYFMSSSANQGVGNPVGTGGVKVLSDTQMRNQSAFTVLTLPRHGISIRENILSPSAVFFQPVP